MEWMRGLISSTYCSFQSQHAAKDNISITRNWHCDYLSMFSLQQYQIKTKQTIGLVSLYCPQ